MTASIGGSRARRRTVEAGVLSVAYEESGPETGEPVILLHGFPYDMHAYDAVAARLSAEGRLCIVPSLRGYGDTRFLSAETPRSGEQAALGADLLALLDALGIESAHLGGYDWGGRAACIVAALWPGRVRGLVSCGIGYNIQKIAASGQPADPATEHRLWYQYYFHSERGRAGLAAHRGDLCRLLWQLWSPSWAFDEKIFADSAAAFDNPDFVEVVIHSYRHRFGLVAGDPDLLAIESLLSAQPDISVPTIVMEGAMDGVEGPIKVVDPAKRHFTGPYERRIVEGVGHNMPQEAPQAFAEAILSLP
ncbi:MULTISPECIES: alpha/beta fold hydrolase [unclassified Aureimonas]|uniref:alpha/beta fold hydrolase n=1 Tax=unclassified Aureimonas TaxID=2615206 RepID=UPI0006F9FFC2|nr:MULTISPECIES: alpha/beta hydrolase [unclassified Aureimonas]KQT64167.1 alpha/beta hydrolase [Aureimonas sp. Leaf427]KQT81356.1 alpha/beta hydrolase [Aureimonas sp. Leaf460]